MQSDKTSEGGNTVLNVATESPMRFNRRSYRQFSRWLDGELLKLVNRWAHSAAPCSKRISRGRSKSK